MLYQLDITLTEEDYLAFNHFHALESLHGKRGIKKARIFFITAMVILMALIVLLLGWTTFSVSYAIFLGLFTALHMLLYKKILKKNIKKQLQRLKKIGKLPFDSVSKLEFYEDKLVEITAAKRIEQSYGALERICLVGERFVLLYHSSVGAYILPIPQLREQLEQKELIRFLLQKCNTVEYYQL